MTQGRLMKVAHRLVGSTTEHAQRYVLKHELEGRIAILRQCKRLVLMQTKDCLRNPAILLELHVAIRCGVVICPVQVQGGGYSFADAHAHIMECGSKDSQRDKLTYEVVESILREQGTNMRRLMWTLAGALPALISIKFSPSSTDTLLRATVLDILERTADRDVVEPGGAVNRKSRMPESSPFSPKDVNLSTTPDFTSAPSKFPMLSKMTSTKNSCKSLTTPAALPKGASSKNNYLPSRMRMRSGSGAHAAFNWGVASAAVTLILPSQASVDTYLTNTEVDPGKILNGIITLQSLARRKVAAGVSSAKATASSALSPLQSMISQGSATLCQERSQRHANESVPSVDQVSSVV